MAISDREAESDMRPLKSFINSPVRLYFRDGEVVEAELLAVDETDHRDITYEVRKIVVTQRSAKGSAVGTTCIAPIDDLARWEGLSRGAM